MRWALLALPVLLAACGASHAPRDAVFWTQSPHGGEDERGSIGRVNLTGSGADGELIGGAKAPAGIAVSGRYVYWTNYATGTIARARLDGSDVNERFIKGGGEYSIVGIAVDSQHIYWTSSGFDPNRGAIGRANLDGSGVQQHFIQAGDSPVGIAVDRRHLYWTHRYWNRDYTVSGYAIGRAELNGSSAEERFIEAPNKLDGIAVTDHYIFWSSDGEHAIGRANLDGTEVAHHCITTQTEPLETVPEGLAANDRYVYSTSYPANTIARATLDGWRVDLHFMTIKGVPEGIAVAGDDGTGNSVGGCRKWKAPLLFGPTDQRAGYYAAGWGEVAPAVVSNGGASASGTISRIHWSGWGGKVALGHGLNPTFMPHGGYYRKPVVIELRASDIRRCKRGGRLVYTRFSAREQVRPGGPMGKWFAWAADMCRGFR